jgi:hypothetical protein
MPEGATCTERGECEEDIRTDRRLDVVQTHAVQLLAAVNPSLVAQLVVDGEGAVGVLVPREHGGSEPIARHCGK